MTVHFTSFVHENTTLTWELPEFEQPTGPDQEWSDDFEGEQITKELPINWSAWDAYHTQLQLQEVK